MIRKLRQRPIVPFMLLLVAAVVAAGCGATDDPQDSADPESLMENNVPPPDGLDLPPTANEPLPSDEADNEFLTPEVDDEVEENILP